MSRSGQIYKLIVPTKYYKMEIGKFNTVFKYSAKGYERGGLVNG